MKKWAWPWTRGAPKHLEVPFNIYVIAEASDFKFGLQVGFAKARHKSPTKQNVSVALD